MTHLRVMLFGIAALSLAFNGHAQNTITNWTTIASTTIVTNGGEAPGASGVWFAYTSIAVYDAVNAIQSHKFQPFYYSGKGRPQASADAAAVAAAHRVLVNYFPAQQAALDSQFQSSIAAITATPWAVDEGIATGEAAAEALISERVGDGLNANVPYNEPPGPGVWEPYPPGSSPVTPWLGQMRPFTMRSDDQFLPDGPTALTSEECVADYKVTRLFGGANSDLRTAAQREIGLFLTMHTGAQYSAVFNGLVQQYKLDLMESALLLAILWSVYADEAIGCYYA
jgi:hypothetical protein